MRKCINNCSVVIETRGKEKIQPAILIKDNNGKVTMITITPDHNFECTDETGNWDIVDGATKYIGEA